MLPRLGVAKVSAGVALCGFWADILFIVTRRLPITRFFWCHWFWKSLLQVHHLDSFDVNPLHVFRHKPILLTGLHVPTHNRFDLLPFSFGQFGHQL